MYAEFCFFSYFFGGVYERGDEGLTNLYRIPKASHSFFFIPHLFWSHFDSIQETWIEINQENWCAASVVTRVAIFAFLVVVALFMR